MARAAHAHMPCAVCTAPPWWQGAPRAVTLRAREHVHANAIGAVFRVVLQLQPPIAPVLGAKSCEGLEGPPEPPERSGHVHTLHHSAERHGEMVTCAYNKKANQCTCKCMMRSAPAAAVQTAV